MKVYFFHFEKKLNSTKRPNLQSDLYFQYDVNWKRPTSITSPTIEIAVETISEWDLDYNYVYIPSFKRFYFIQNLTVVSANLIEYSLSVDVLASYKDDILGSSLYVLRSSSNYSRLIPDEAIVHNSKVNHVYNASSLNGLNPTGCYILTVINGDSFETANPSNTMYVVSGSELASFVSYIYDEARISDFSDPDLVATFYNPLQYVTSCRWFPLDKASIQGNETTIKYGWYDTNINAHYVTRYGVTIHGSIEVPLSQDDWFYLNNDWVNHSLYIRGFGSCDIDPIYSGETLDLDVFIDFNTGNSRCLIKNGSSPFSDSVINELHGKLSAEVSLAQLEANPNLPLSKDGLIKTGASIIAGTKGLGASVVNFFKDVTSGKGLVNSVTQNFGKNTASSIAESTKQNLLNPSVHTLGANGDIYFIKSQVGTALIHTRYFLPESYPTLECGKPLNKVVQLSTLSGYTQVANGLIRIGGLVEERNAITTILEGGFIIE